MLEVIEQFGAYVSVIVALTSFAVTQAVKSYIKEENVKFIPMVAITVGAVSNTLLVATSGGSVNQIVEAVLIGIISGAAAIGIYEVTKKTEKESDE